MLHPSVNRKIRLSGFLLSPVFFLYLPPPAINFSHFLPLSPTPVKQHTIRQLFSSFGEEDAQREFYVFKRDQELQKLPVNYPYRSDHFTIALVTEGNASV